MTPHQSFERRVKKVDCKSPTAEKDFVTSLRESGFAVLSNHPISQSLIVDAYRDWEAFFKTDEKHAHTFDVKIQAGYFPFRSENAKDYQIKDLKEFYHYYPTRMALPKSTEQSTKALYAAMVSLGTELLGWIQRNTTQEVKFPMPLQQMIQKSEETVLRILHYPPLKGVEEQGAVRAAAHEDINLITLLPAATAPGLQVKDLEGQWHTVPCDPGTIVINSGDMLKEASQGYYPSTTHRVINPSGPEAQNSRYSMPLFLHPHRDAPLSARYTGGTYLDQRLREIGLK